jgi:hypothetical protein
VAQPVSEALGIAAMFVGYLVIESRSAVRRTTVA